MKNSFLDLLPLATIITNRKMTYKYSICHPEKEKMVVDDIRGFSLENSLTYLEHFLSGNHSSIEKLYEK